MTQEEMDQMRATVEAATNAARAELGEQQRKTIERTLGVLESAKVFVRKGGSKQQILEALSLIGVDLENLRSTLVGDTGAPDPSKPIAGG